MNTVWTIAAAVAWLATAIAFLSVLGYGLSGRNPEYLQMGLMAAAVGCAGIAVALFTATAKESQLTVALGTLGLVINCLVIYSHHINTRPRPKPQSPASPSSEGPA